MFIEHSRFILLDLRLPDMFNELAVQHKKPFNEQE